MRRVHIDQLTSEKSNSDVLEANGNARLGMYDEKVRRCVAKVTQKKQSQLFNVEKEDPL
jgi:hypothetical protein